MNAAHSKPPIEAPTRPQTPVVAQGRADTVMQLDRLDLTAAQGLLHLRREQTIERVHGLPEIVRAKHLGTVVRNHCVAMTAEPRQHRHHGEHSQAVAHEAATRHEAQLTAALTRSKHLQLSSWRCSSGASTAEISTNAPAVTIAAGSCTTPPRAAIPSAITPTSTTTPINVRACTDGCSSIRVGPRTTKR